MADNQSGRDYHVLELHGAAPTTGDSAPPIRVERTITFDYQDKDGELAYQVVREEFADGGKAFKQRQPDSAGGWLWSIKGITPLPYRLPELLRTVQRGGVVFLVEGEKAADALNAAIRAADLRAIATTNNGGARHWGADQSKHLRGASVALLPDNDEAGRDHVEIAARSLTGLAASVKRIDLPGLPDKGDIADWLTAGHTIDELRALYHAASEYTPPTPLSAPERPTPRSVSRNDKPRLSAWAQKALEGELDDLAGLSDGRFHALTQTANRLGTIAAHGLLTESECMAGLTWAMQVNGYTAKPGKRNGAADKEARFYFRSGLDYPCLLPEARELPALERPNAVIPDDFVAYIPSAKTTWNEGVPVAVRGLFNAYQGNGPLLELIFEGKNAGLIPDASYIPIECLSFVSKKLGRRLSEGTIRTMVRTATDPHGVQFLRKSGLYSTDHSIDSNDRDIDPCADFQRNPCGCVGRSPEYYELLPIETILLNLARFINAPLVKAAFPDSSDLIAPICVEFIAALERPDADALYDTLSARYGPFIESQPGFQDAMKQVFDERRQWLYRLRNPHSASIPSGMTYKNTSEYKSACAYALVNERGGRAQIPRKTLCALIGCKDTQLKGVLDRAGIEMLKHQYASQIITSLADLKAIKFAYDKRYKGFPRLVKSSGQGPSVDGTKPIKFGSRGMFTFVSDALAAGLKVEVLYHQANIQVIRRVSDMVIRFMHFLLTMMISILKPLVKDEIEQQEMFPEPEPEEDEPEEPAKPVKKPRVPVKKMTWEERWVKKMANEFTAYQIDPDIATEKTTGKVVPPTIQLAFDALLSHEIAPEIEDQAWQPDHIVAIPLQQVVPASVQPAFDPLSDPVLRWLVDECGSTITKVIETGSVTAPPASESMGDHRQWESLAEGQSDLSTTSALSPDVPSRKALQPQATSFSGWLFGMSRCLLPICERLSESILNIRPTIRVLM